jgi:hypothetical protein
VIELGQAPIDQSELFLLVVDHDVVGLDVSVHDSLGMTEVKRLGVHKRIGGFCASGEHEWGFHGTSKTDFEQLEDVESDVIVGKFGV